MNLKQLKSAIAHYDTSKGILRRLFGDANSIVALKQFILSLNTPDDETRKIKFSEFMKYSRDNNYNFPLSTKYLNSSTLSSTILKTWKNEKIKPSASPIKINPVKFDSSKLIEDYFQREIKLPQMQPLNAGEIHNIVEKSSSDLVREVMRKKMDEAIFDSSKAATNFALKNPRPICCFISTTYTYHEPLPKPDLYEDRPDGFVMLGRSI